MRSSHINLTATLLLAALTSFPGCGGTRERPDDDQHPMTLMPLAPPPSPEEAESILAQRLAAYPHALVKLTETPVRSVAAPSSFIDVWVSAHGVDAYQQIRPGKTSSHMTLPEGTVVVRAVRNAAGRLSKTTVLEKRAPGYNPPSDLWFATYEPGGQLAMDASGVPMEGRMPACNTCHLSRAYDGYVFGVPNP